VASSVNYHTSYEDYPAGLRDLDNAKNNVNFEVLSDDEIRNLNKEYFPTNIVDVPTV
jgi:hypothetical protein